MKRILPTFLVFSLSTINALFLSAGCAPSHHSPIEVRMAERLEGINSRLGTTRDDLWKEISNSGSYSRDQALELKHRVGELVVAYEELAVEANCARPESR